jgi:hypothetical protein
VRFAILCLTRRKLLRQINRQRTAQYEPSSLSELESIRSSSATTPKVDASKLSERKKNGRTEEKTQETQPHTSISLYLQAEEWRSCKSKRRLIKTEEMRKEERRKWKERRSKRKQEEKRRKKVEGRRRRNKEEKIEEEDKDENKPPARMYEVRNCADLLR